MSEGGLLTNEQFNQVLNNLQLNINNMQTNLENNLLKIQENLQSQINHTQNPEPSPEPEPEPQPEPEPEPQPEPEPEPQPEPQPEPEPEPEPQPLNYTMNMANQDDGIIVFDNTYTTGSFSFKGYNSDDSFGTYYNLGSTGNPSNWGWQIDVFILFELGTNMQTGQYIYLYGITGEFIYKVELSENKQEHYINNELVYTTELSTLNVKGINLYAAENFVPYYDDIKFNDGNEDIVHIDMANYSEYLNKAVSTIPNFPILPWASGSLNNTLIIDLQIQPEQEQEPEPQPDDTVAYTLVRRNSEKPVVTNPNGEQQILSSGIVYLYNGVNQIEIDSNFNPESFGDAGYVILIDENNNIVFVSSSQCKKYNITVPLTTTTITCPVHPMFIDISSSYSDVLDSGNYDIFKSTFDISTSNIDYDKQELITNGFVSRDLNSDLISYVCNYENVANVPSFWWYYKDNDGDLVKFNTNSVPTESEIQSNNLIFKATYSGPISPIDPRGMLDSVFSMERIYQLINKLPSLDYIKTRWPICENYVNYKESCNAFFSFDGTVNYYQAGVGGFGLCNKTCSLNVEGHEYGHGIHRFAIPDSGLGDFDTELSEGFADFIGLIIEYATFGIWGSIIGKYFLLTDPDAGIRDVSPNMIWPFNWDNNNQSSPHGDGLIFGGSMYDIINLTNVYSDDNYSFMNIVDDVSNIAISAIKNNPNLGGENGIGKYMKQYYDNNMTQFNNQLTIPLYLGLQNHGLINMEVVFYYEVGTSTNININSNDNYSYLVVPNILSEQFSENDPIYDNSVTISIPSSNQSSDIYGSYVTKNSNGDVGSNIIDFSFENSSSINLTDVESFILFNNTNNNVTFTCSDIKLEDVNRILYTNKGFILLDEPIVRKSNFKGGCCVKR